jgi:CDP-diacylglycerol---glycerol-3-phosphate 3-phosphatidyltransferase
MFENINVANFFSFSRIILTPIIGCFLCLGGYYLFVALVFFTVAIATDYYDGYFARKYNYKTEFGNFLDPLADKILVMSIFFVFYFLSIVSLYVVLIMLFRDVVITLARGCLTYHGSSLKTSRLGKYKTFLQFIFIYLILVQKIMLFQGFFLQYLQIVEWTSAIVLYVVIALAIYSACDYCYVSLFGKLDLCILKKLLKK